MRLWHLLLVARRRRRRQLLTARYPSESRQSATPHSATPHSHNSAGPAGSPRRRSAPTARSAAAASTRRTRRTAPRRRCTRWSAPSRSGAPRWGSSSRVRRLAARGARRAGLITVYIITWQQPRRRAAVLQTCSGSRLIRRERSKPFTPGVPRNTYRGHQAVLDGAAAVQPRAAVQESARGGGRAVRDAGGERGPRARRERDGGPAVPLHGAAQPAGAEGGGSALHLHACLKLCMLEARGPAVQGQCGGSRAVPLPRRSVFCSPLCPSLTFALLALCAGCPDGGSYAGAAQALWHQRHRREGGAAAEAVSTPTGVVAPACRAAILKPTHAISCTAPNISTL